MKRVLNILFIVFLVVFFCMPFHTHAAIQYVYFTTTIHNWNHVDSLKYPCGSLNSYIELWNDVDHYTYGGCYNNTVNINNYSFSGDSDIIIRERIRVNDSMKTNGFYFLGFFGNSDEYTNTPFEAYLKRNYHNPSYFKVVEEEQIDPDGSAFIENEESSLEEINEVEESDETPLEEESTEEEFIEGVPHNYEILRTDGAIEFTNVVVGSTMDLGTVSYPNSYYLKYQFVVRGDLADPSGTFQYRFDEVESYRTAVHGDSIAFGSNIDPSSPFYKVLTLSDLNSALEEKPDVLYTGVYNENEYSIFLHTVGGERYGAIVADPEDPDSYGLTLELEARNDSEIANTGLLYDLGPFFILAIAIIVLFLVFRKVKIKEESLDQIDDEII